MDWFCCCCVNVSEEESLSEITSLHHSNYGENESFNTHLHRKPLKCADSNIHWYKDIVYENESEESNNEEIMQEVIAHVELFLQSNSDYYKTPIPLRKIPTLENLMHLEPSISQISSPTESNSTCSSSEKSDFFKDLESGTLKPQPPSGTLIEDGYADCTFLLCNRIKYSDPIPIDHTNTYL